jgi:Tol biopolymer transport system component
LIGWKGNIPVINLMVVREGAPLAEAVNLTPSETVYSGDASICRHGDKIAFASGEAVWNETTQAWELVNWGIYVADLEDDDSDGLPDGLASKFKVCDWPASVACYRISWAPNDDRLAFDDSLSPGPRPDVFVVNVQPDATPVNITGTDRIEEMAPEWSPDGSKIAFTRSVSNKKGSLLGYKIYTMDPDGSGLALAIGKSNTGYAWNLFPSWSEDGTQIVCRVSQAWGTSGTDAVMRSAADGSTSAADLTGFAETDPTCIRWVW